jgi:hypothetical protein
MKMTSRETELKNLLNSLEFNSDAWNAASKELHEIRIKDITDNPPKLPADWCTSDGRWWN